MKQRMKARILTLAIALAMCATVRAVIIGLLEAPQDDVAARRAVLERPEVKAAATNYDELIRLNIWPLKLADFTKIFGPKLEAPPADIALPVARGAGYAVSGLHSGAA